MHLALLGSGQAIYEQFYKIVCWDIAASNPIVCLKASTDLLMRRIIMLRDRPLKRNVSVQYMERLNGYYEDYFSYQSNFLQTKLANIDTDRLNFASNSHNLEFICRKILEKDG